MTISHLKIQLIFFFFDNLVIFKLAVKLTEMRDKRPSAIMQPTSTSWDQSIPRLTPDFESSNGSMQKSVEVDPCSGELELLQHITGLEEYHDLTIDRPDLINQLDLKYDASFLAGVDQREC